MDVDYENHYSADSYASGCSCSCCVTEGRLDTQPGEICTARRYADSWA